MDIFKTDLFKFVSGDMLDGKTVMMTIRAVELEKVTGPQGENEKPMVYFQGSKKPLILNKTNAVKLYKALGRETTAWHGAKVELYPEEVKAFGKVSNAVRIGKIEKPTPITPQQRRARQAGNNALLHGDDTPIGETIKPLDLYAPAPAQATDQAQPAAAEEFDF